MKKCYSCGMLLDSIATSKFNTIYCLNCQDQESGFLATYEQVHKESVKAATKYLGKTKIEAGKMADTMLPQLPRWKRVLKS